MDCLKVPKSEGEKIRKELMKRDLLNQDGKIESEDDYLFIPIESDDEFKLDELDYEVVDREIEKRDRKERDYKELVIVPKKMKKHLPSSMMS